MRIQLKEALASRALIYGCWVRIPSTHTLRLVARGGFDWVVLDVQHGAIGYESMISMIELLNSLGIPSIVRVQSAHPFHVSAALDAGAHGILLPMLKSAAEVRAGVAACRYPPLGERSFEALGLGGADYAEANRLVVSGITLETAQAFDDLANIAEVPGLDLISVGKGDLSLSLGRDPVSGAEDPRMLKMIESVRSVCEQKGIAMGTWTGGLERAQRWVDRGVTFLSVDSDTDLIARAARASNEAIDALRRAREKQVR